MVTATRKLENSFPIIIVFSNTRLFGLHFHIPFESDFCHLKMKPYVVLWNSYEGEEFTKEEQDR